ncbi:hypothetical protein MTO96_040680 [Rhipicephalus appendiculatus]
MTLMSQLSTGGAAGGTERLGSDSSKRLPARHDPEKGQQRRFLPIMEGPREGGLTNSVRERKAVPEASHRYAGREYGDVLQDEKTGT